MWGGERLMGRSLSQGYTVALPLAVLTGSCGHKGCRLRELGRILTLPAWSGVAARCRPASPDWPLGQWTAALWSRKLCALGGEGPPDASDTGHIWTDYLSVVPSRRGSSPVVVWLFN